jgi:signal transduction histidine kinase
MTPTPELRQIYFMTHSIADRTLSIFTHGYDDRFEKEEDVNGVKLGFYEGTITAQSLINTYPALNFEIVGLFSVQEVAESLACGRIDAFVADTVVSAEYEDYPSVHSKEFFPLVYTPVSLTTGNPELEPVISIVDKYIEAGGIDWLYELYREGRYDYAKFELSKSFTDAEIEYMANLTRNRTKVPIALEHDNYPICFYNINDKEFQGIAPDILSEITMMTGIEFRVVTDENTPWYAILEMLNTNEVSLVSELLYTPERSDKYLWSMPYSTTHYSLISKIDYPHLEMPQIVRTRVGVNRGTAYEEMYKSWFPNNTNLVYYDSTIEAMDALERGEIDLVMASEKALITMTNYNEKPGFIINIRFNMMEESYFGFNLNEELLASIIRKSQNYIATEKINSFWTNRIFDYARKLTEAQRPWLFGAIVLSLALLSLILVLLYRTRSERKRLAKLVAEQTEEVRSASEAKSRFIANMSHEMRTPMNVIVGFTDLMMEEDIPADIKEMLRKVSTAGNTLMGLINDVLDISKIEAGKVDLVPVQYDVANLLNDIITLNMIRVGEKLIAFKLDIRDNLPSRLFGDDLRVKQIFNNLLSNAFKYTKEGFVTLGVDCQREGDDLWFTFYISDTGIGIRKEDISKLFTDYNQVDAKANRKIEGTGLGLSITKKLVELMDGKIAVESEYGKGTTFHVRIRQGFVTDTPIDEEAVDRLRSLRYSDNKKRTHEKLVLPDLSYARVLVVDDFSANLEVAAGRLSKYKMQVDCLSSGQDAIDCIAIGLPVYDAIFMDQMMPGMDGIQATALIRALGTEYAKNVPIIALSANAVTGTEQMFLDNGFNAFLPKPFNAVSLDAIIQRWVKKQ